MNYSEIRTVDPLALGPDWSCPSFDFPRSLDASSGHGAHPHESAVCFISITIHKVR